MTPMKHWYQSIALLTVLIGTLGEGAVMASSLNQLSSSPSQKTVAGETFQLAQRGRRGDCRAANRDTPVFAEANVRDQIGYLLEDDVVELRENNYGGREFIQVYSRDLRREGYVYTRDLKYCSDRDDISSAATCRRVIESVGIYENPTLRSRRRETLNPRDLFDLDLREEPVFDDRDNEWVKVITRFGVEGWITRSRGRRNLLTNCP